MAPPVEGFPAAQLPYRVQFHADGRRRKQPVELECCPLRQMTQYFCDVVDRNDPRARIVCRPVVRTFRRCPDGLTVETTPLEGEDAM